jgi:hypothetical protein
VSTHRVLRVHGGRLVVAERRVELQNELDELDAGGYHLATSFVVDDNVYLIMRRSDEGTVDRAAARRARPAERSSEEQR